MNGIPNKLTVTALLVLAITQLIPAAQLQARDERWTKIDEIVQAEVKLDLFSGTVVVAENGKTEKE